MLIRPRPVRLQSDIGIIRIIFCMPILDTIEKIQKKPLYYRKRVLFFTTSIITGIIAVIWFETFDFNLNPVDSKAVSEEFKPLSEIKNSISDFFGEAKKLGAETLGKFTSGSGGDLPTNSASSSLDFSNN